MHVLLHYGTYGSIVSSMFYGVVSVFIRFLLFMLIKPMVPVLWQRRILVEITFLVLFLM